MKRTQADILKETLNTTLGGTEVLLLIGKGHVASEQWEIQWKGSTYEVVLEGIHQGSHGHLSQFDIYKGSMKACQDCIYLSRHKMPKDEHVHGPWP